MTVGYQLSSGVDLDAAFKARTSSPAAAVGYKDSAGTDLNNRYEPRGSTAARADTGYRNSAGTDLAQIFMDIAAATGTLIFNQTMTAAANTGQTVQIGYQRYTTGLADFGSISGTTVDGVYTFEGLAKGITGTGNLFSMSNAGSSTWPPDADTTWQRIEVTGIFSDSGGGSVTRTLARTDCTVARNDIESSRSYRQWSATSQPFPFIAGNSYTVKIYKS